MGSGSPFRVANANRVTSDNNNNNYPTIRSSHTLFHVMWPTTAAPGERRDKLPPTHPRWWNLLLIAVSFDVSAYVKSSSGVEIDLILKLLLHLVQNVQFYLVSWTFACSSCSHLCSVYVCNCLCVRPLGGNK